LIIFAVLQVSTLDILVQLFFWFRPFDSWIFRCNLSITVFVCGL